MKGLRTETLANGTPRELVQAAEMRARMAARRRRSAGQADETILREILARFREVIATESFGAYADETILAAARRAVEEVLREDPGGAPDP
jgi:hypothetical protein